VRSLQLVGKYFFQVIPRIKPWLLVTVSSFVIPEKRSSQTTSNWFSLKIVPDSGPRKYDLMEVDTMSNETFTYYLEAVLTRIEGKIDNLQKYVNQKFDQIDEQLNRGC
jgi:hypothetical protein